MEPRLSHHAALCILTLTFFTASCQNKAPTEVKTETPVQELKPVTFTAEDLKENLKNKEAMTKGRGVYSAKCASCHGGSGEGGIGPNLCDDFWLHGGLPNQIATTVYNGVKDKGMIPWGQILTREEILQVASYVASLRGKSTPGGKPPQGTKEERPQ